LYSIEKCTAGFVWVTKNFGLCSIILQPEYRAASWIGAAAPFLPEDSAWWRNPGIAFWSPDQLPGAADPLL